MSFYIEDMSRKSPLPFRWFLAFAFLFALQAVPRIFSDSLVSDEPMEVANGAAYWAWGGVEDFRYHPPLATALQALPLAILHLAPPPRGATPEDRAFAFFFKGNPGRLLSMTVRPRLVTLLFGLGIGVLLFLLTRGSPPAAFTALGLWAFEPNLLAFSGYAMADVPLTFLFLSAVMVFEQARSSKGIPASLAAGFLAGAACCAKYSGLVLLPVFVALEVAGRGSGPVRRGLLRRWGLMTGGFALAVLLVYLPGTLRLEGHPDPFGSFLAGLGDLVAYGKLHHPTFFMGDIRHGNHLLYYPAVFLLKTPLPFLFLALAAAAQALRGRLHLPAWEWVSPLAIFLAIIPVQNLGVRYLLPAFPFLILMSARLGGSVWSEGKGRKRWMRIVLAGLLSWQAVSVAVSFPGHVSYFNEAVPASRRTWWLADSNYDIGQDLGRLGRVARERGWKEVRLAYFGPTDPAAYGIPWRPWCEKDLEGPQPGRVYAIHTGYFQLVGAFFPSSLPVALSWVVQGSPTGVAGETFYYFEIPGMPVPDDSPAVPSVPYLRR